MAHEIGHHLQTLTGVSEQVRAQQQRNPGAANDLSIALELQADCYAGVWGKLAGEQGNVTISQAELGQALRAAEAVGDDRIQQQTQGQVNPETWTHGSAEQRREWYERGYASGDVATCNTFT
jgi:predicted metalloprotease